MDKKTVVLIKSNLMAEETRRPKLARALARKYDVLAISWDRGQLSPQIQKPLNNNEEITLKLKAPIGSMSLFFLPIWWCYLFISLMAQKWDVAHVVNFDSIIPTILAGKIKKKPVIYEILDTYVDQMKLPDPVREVGILVDKLFISLADAVVIADEGQIEEFRGIPNSKIVPIYDSPEVNDNMICGCQKNEVFTLFFAGMLTSARALNLERIFEAIEDISNVQVIIAGYGDLVETINEWVLKMPEKIQYIGPLSHEEVLRRSAQSDLLFVLRDPIVPVNKYICGSKLLEAMMCGKPLLVNQGTSTADIVQKENCGVVVDAKDITEVRDAIIRLRNDPDLCRVLGSNAHEAYQKKYGWSIMENRLLSLYEELMVEY